MKPTQCLCRLKTSHNPWSRAIALSLKQTSDYAWRNRSTNGTSSHWNITDGFSFLSGPENGTDTEENRTQNRTLPFVLACGHPRGASNRVLCCTFPALEQCSGHYFSSAGCEKSPELRNILSDLRRSWTGVPNNRTGRGLCTECSLS